MKRILSILATCAAITTFAVEPKPAKPKAKAPFASSQAATSTLRSLELTGTLIKKETTVKDEAKNSEVTTTIYGLKGASGSTIRLPISKTLDYAQFLDQTVIVTGQGYTQSVGGKKRTVLRKVSGVNPRGDRE